VSFLSGLVRDTSELWQVFLNVEVLDFVQRDVFVVEVSLGYLLDE